MKRPETLESDRFEKAREACATSILEDVMLRRRYPAPTRLAVERELTRFAEAVLDEAAKRFEAAYR